MLLFSWALHGSETRADSEARDLFKVTFRKFHLSLSHMFLSSWVLPAKLGPFFHALCTEFAPSLRLPGSSVFDVLTWAPICDTASSWRYFQGHLRRKRGQENSDDPSRENSGLWRARGASVVPWRHLVVIFWCRCLHRGLGAETCPQAWERVHPTDCTCVSGSSPGGGRAGIVYCTALNTQPAGGSSTSACWSSC